MKTKMIIAGIASLVAVSGANAASLNFVGAVAGKSGTVQVTYNSNTYNVGAGALEIKIDGGPSIEAYCVDLDHFISAGNTWNVNILGLASHPASMANKAQAANVLASHYNSVASVSDGVGLQLALWDVLYDGGDGLAAGLFKSNAAGANLTAYNSVMTTSNAPSQSPSNFNFNYYQAITHGQNGDRNQDLISLDPVPEPATMVLLGGMAAAAIARRRKA